MRLETAIYASREGITAHGQALAVIGDNVSNANTTAYRAARAEFTDLLPDGERQSESTPSVGSGVALSRVRIMPIAGVIEQTDRALDVALDGRGFLVVGSAADQLYTRAGNLAINGEGILVDANGYAVLGYVGDGTSLTELDTRKVTTSSKATSASSMFGNLDASSAVTTVPANPASFTEIGQLASFTNNMQVYDSLGAAHDVTVAFFKTAANTWTAQAYIDGADTGGTAGVPVSLGSTTLSFGSDGRIPETGQAAVVINAAPAYGNGAAAGSFTIALGGFTQFAGSSQLLSVNQDGQGAGNIQNYEIDETGNFIAVMDNGQRVAIGTIQLANFPNFDGMERIGNGLFRATDAAGERTLGAPGTVGFGKTQDGSLERSNVDIADQFVNMVLYQRGYQANSQTLNASSQMLRETLQLIR